MYVIALPTLNSSSHLRGKPSKSLSRCLADTLPGQCTSFVAYRLNKAGVKFTNHYKGEGWHNANTWNEAAKKAGVKVNKTPKVGSVAQTDAGSAGHVAWVTKVGKKTVTIEEYNWNNPEKYGTRTVPKEKFRYIHIKN